MLSRGWEGTCVCVLAAQSCPILCDPTDCSPPGSSVYGILQASILEWVAISFSRGSSRPKDWTQISCIAGRFFTIWATREGMKDPNMKLYQTWKLAACLGYVPAPEHSTSPRGPCWTVRAIGSVLMEDQHQNIKSSGIRSMEQLPWAHPRHATLSLDSVSRIVPGRGPSEGPYRKFPIATASGPKDIPASRFRFDPTFCCLC